MACKGGQIGIFWEKGKAGLECYDGARMARDFEKDLSSRTSIDSDSSRERSGDYGRYRDGHRERNDRDYDRDRDRAPKPTLSLSSSSGKKLIDYDSRLERALVHRKWGHGEPLYFQATGGSSGVYSLLEVYPPERSVAGAGAGAGLARVLSPVKKIWGMGEGFVEWLGDWLRRDGPRFANEMFKAWLRAIEAKPSIYDLRETYIKTFESLMGDSPKFPYGAYVRVALVVYSTGGKGDLSLAGKLHDYLSGVPYTRVTIYIYDKYVAQMKRFVPKAAEVVGIPILAKSREADSKETQRLIGGNDLFIYLEMAEGSSILNFFEDFKDQNPGFFNVATFSEFNLNPQEVMDNDEEKKRLLVDKGMNLLAYYESYAKLITFPLGIGELELVDRARRRVVFRRPYDGIIILNRPKAPPFTKPWPRCPEFGIPGIDFDYAMGYVYIGPFGSSGEGGTRWACVVKFIRHLIPHYYATHKPKQPLHLVLPRPDEMTLPILETELEKALPSGSFAIFSDVTHFREYHVTPETKIILNFQVLPLPYNEMLQAISNSYDEILVTGDQSVADVLSCCPLKTIYYQNLPWKVDFARQLGHVLHLPHLVSGALDGSTCVPLDGGPKKERLGVSFIVDQWSFAKRAQGKLLGLIQASILRANYPPFREALDRVAALVRAKILAHADSSKDREEIKHLIRSFI